jgi:hypothetical protein
MPHLDAERLAALDHDPLTAEELAHLAGCAACRLERDAYARLAVLTDTERTRAASALDAPALTEWGRLSAALRAEGLITRPSDDADVFGADVIGVDGQAPSTHVMPSVSHAMPSAIPRDDVAPSAARQRAVGRGHERRRWFGGAWRAAAAVALFASGAMVGRGTASSSLAGDAVSPVASTESLDLAVASDRGVPEFTSMSEATRVLEQAQRDYERASLWLASHDTTVNAQSVYRARLAALEQMLTASRAGLFEAPQDPVLNQYYLAAYTAREATLRQLGEALPVNRVMESF